MLISNVVRKRLFFFLILLFSLNANAVLISKDWKTEGDNLITVDTVSGLEWLDLTQTYGQSYNTVAASFGVGGAYEGWSYANLYQIANFINAAGGTPPYGGSTLINNGVTSALFAFWGEPQQGLLTASVINIGGTADGEHEYSIFDDTPNTNFSSISDYIQLGGSSAPDTSLDYSHALVRPVVSSEPALSAVTIDYNYDDLNRLRGTTRSDGLGFTYDYDEVGNLTYKAINSPDSDGDLLSDIQEIFFGLNPNQADTDGDGIDDYTEACFDRDCENYNPFDSILNPNGTDLNANLTDTDGDGISDGVELLEGSDPLSSTVFPLFGDGDINIDGIINTIDILLAIKIAQQQIVPDQLQLLHGDVAPLVNGVPQPDGIINVGDVLIIQRKALGKVDF